MIKQLSKYVGIVFIVLMIAAALVVVFNPGLKATNVSLSEAVTKINSGSIKEIVVRDDTLEMTANNGDKFTSKKETNVSAVETLTNLGADKNKLNSIQITVAEAGGAAVVLSAIIPIVLPFLLIIFIFWFMFRQAQKGSMQAFSFGKSKAKLADSADGKKKLYFKDVAGLIEAKEEISEVVEFLKDPKRFHKLGARIPRGILLVGSPGTGKTLLAKAVANEANVPFYFVSGSEFVEMFVGVGASVTGDTPILVRTPENTKLLPIKDFVDKYYENHKGKGVVPVRNIKTLGFEAAKTNFCGFRDEKKEKHYFGKSKWQNVGGVFRHKAESIYEIEFLGGKIKTTGDHSVFVREKNYIRAKKSSELRVGDKLVNLPFKVRGKFITGLGTTHNVKSFEFPLHSDMEIPIWEEDETLSGNYQFALNNMGIMPQWQIGQMIGASQMSISEWQRGITKPRSLSLDVYTTRKNLPKKIRVTPGLMRLLGYYLAEGRTTKYFTQFIFGAHEDNLHRDCNDLIRSIFNLVPRIEFTEDNTARINVSSVDLSKFFTNLCGTGSTNKHIPEFMWDMPYEYFAELLNGYTLGDGYTSKEGKLTATSVSKQLILELSWLCSMHGLKAAVGRGVSKPGRIIKKNAVVSTNPYWRLIIGKSSHPFRKYDGPGMRIKKAIVKKITVKSYNDYVYDLCGCDQEAFFGGEQPILLHNSRVKDTFDVAKKTAPSIIFIDEIDAVGRHRGAGLGGGHDEREQTLNQILVEMDGFNTDDAVIIISATNRPDILDPALLRPGRFDRRIILDEPSLNDREAILKIHAQEKPLAKDVNLRVVAERTPGFSGADLANLLNEGAILAARKDQKEISQDNILEAIEKVILGPERRSHIFSKKEKEITAYHEAGHALVATSLPHTDPVHKVSIVSRGRAGGYTLKLPTEDKHLKSKSEFESELAVLLGGYAAEKIMFKEVTTGASNDLRVASDLARRMVTEFGMSDSLGPITYGEKDEFVFLGKELTNQKNYSETIAYEIDKEVKKLVGKGLILAKKVLSEKINLLNKIAQELIGKETLEQKEFYALVR